MKAIVHTQYGPPDVLQFTEVAKPTFKDDEVLIKKGRKHHHKKDKKNSILR